MAPARQRHDLPHHRRPLPPLRLRLFLALVAVLVVSALCVALRAASLWLRFEKACGGHASAMNVLTAAEHLVDDVTDTGISRGMRSAWRRGLLKEGDL
jgi:hypothetical protein